MAYISFLALLQPATFPRRSPQQAAIRPYMKYMPTQAAAPQRRRRLQLPRSGARGPGRPGRGMTRCMIDRLWKWNGVSAHFTMFAEQMALLQLSAYVDMLEFTVYRVALDDRQQFSAPRYGQLFILHNCQPAPRDEQAGEARQHHVPIQPVQAVAGSDQSVRRSE